ncbi:MFS transporter [Chromobacterium vaccinii]|uniref:MFS transporter n=1 Tax=Chromobacterium vaccinii TaxID=1108595 RepID=UPI001E3FE0B1|nr:MFS transporter [Chromobacterium vaccinii]MCD4499772.1 MFS transporter [Chromobacterium vaccinii]
MSHDGVAGLSKRAASGLSVSIVWLLAICCAASVANVYYAQPLLDAIAADFGISHAMVGGVITATQLGCALALFFVVPLGDLLDRKRLVTLQLVALMLALVLVCSANSLWLLLAAMVGVGMLGTAMTQGLIAYSAVLAPPEQRGRVVGAAQSGVVIGLLMARVLAGFVSDVLGWRMVYLVSALFALLMLCFLRLLLPNTLRADTGISYQALLGSMFTLLWREKVLWIRGVLAMLMFAAFSTFWSALVLPLSAAPYSMTHTAIGAFGLVGVIGALAAARAGHLTDRGLGQKTTAWALACLLLSWPAIALMDYSIWLLIVGIILLDLGGQAIHVVNQSMILSSRSDAHSRLIGCYMLFYSVGSGLGAIGSTAMYARWSWLGVCGLGFAISLLALLFWRLSMNAMPRRAPAFALQAD